MSLYSDMVTYLKANTTATIVRPQLRDSDALPAFTMVRSNSRRGYNLTSVDSGYAESYELTAWGQTHLAAQDLADEAITALNGYTGLIGTTRVHQIQITGEVDRFEPEGDREGRLILLDIFHN